MNNIAIYLLKKNKLLKGPYTLDVLKDKGLKASDMVWFKGLDDWTEAKNVEILDEIIESKSYQSNESDGFFARLFRSNR